MSEEVKLKQEDKPEMITKSLAAVEVKKWCSNIVVLGVLQMLFLFFAVILPAPISIGVLGVGTFINIYFVIQGFKRIRELRQKYNI